MSQVPKKFAQAALSRAIQTVYTGAGSIIDDLITDILLSNNSRLDNPQNPTITQFGTPGATAATYYIVAIDAWGNKTMVGAVGSTSTGNATLNGSNYNIISWPQVLGAVSYDVLKTDTAHSLALATAGTLVGSTVSYNDQGGALTAGYVPPTANNTGIKAFVTIHNVPVAGSPSLANRIVAGFEVDPGVPTDIQINVNLITGDMIQARVNSSVSSDALIDGYVSILLGGVEFT